MRTPSYGIPSASLYFFGINSLVLEGVSVHSSYGYGIFAVNVIGKSSVENSSFHFNNYWQAQQFHGSTHEGGNAMFVFTDPYPNGIVVLHNSEHTLTVRNSSFKHGFSGTTNASTTEHETHGAFNGVGGIGVILRMTTYRVVLEFENVEATHNFRDFGSNMYIVNYLRNRAPAQSSSIYINNCTFGKGGTHYLSPSVASAGGAMYIAEIWTKSSERSSTSIVTNHSQTVINITHSKFTHNVAKNGGGLKFTRLPHDNYPYPATYLELKACTFRGNNATLDGSAIHLQSLIAVNNVPPPPHVGYNFTTDSVWIMNISNCTFSHNVANSDGGVYLSTYFSTPSSAQCKLDQKVQLMDSVFYGNKAGGGAAVFVAGINGWRILLTVYNAKFQSNSVMQPDFAIHFPYVSQSNTIHSVGTVFLVQSCESCVVIGDTEFQDNDGSAIVLQDSGVIFAGDVIIANNFNTLGSILLQHSFIFFKPNSHLQFTNNTSLTEGGAILIQSATPICFFQFISLHETGNIKNLNVTVTMENNTALRAGDTIYSELDFEHCGLLKPETNQIFSQLTESMFWSIFHLKHNQSTSEVASQPYKVCICQDGIPNCNVRQVIQSSVFPGQSFSISAVSVGMFNGTAPATVRTVTSKASLAAGQSFQNTPRYCSNLTYSVYTAERTTVSLGIFVKHLKRSERLSRHLELTTRPMIQNATYEIIMLLNQETYLDIKVHISPCPQGFELTDTNNTCDCSKYLKSNGITVCNINKNTIHRPQAIWIGTVPGTNISNTVIHNHCPFDYCKSENSDIQLSYPDEQCALGRGGILCGACGPGFSLTLETSDCRECSNVYLLLTIPFAVAGVVLVFLLLKCNFTVAEGTLNGLILYANIIRMNHNLFFRSEATKLHSVLNILSVFIAWLNMDAGIDWCFYNDMDSYTNTWIQFIFPFYIWLLAGLMVVFSWYFSTAQRIVGSNGVQVLANMFLLAYARLLRTVTTIVSFTTLTDEQGNIATVWLIDGNVPFLGKKHSVLFAMALMTTFLYIIPFTFILLFAPCLQSQSRRRALRWVNKLKPLLDAYMGPYKDRFRCWTGLMLLLRVFLFTTFAGNALGDPRINLLTISATIISLFCFCSYHGRIYKKDFLNFLELFYILNLGILVLATNFIIDTPNIRQVGQGIVTCIMIKWICCLLHYLCLSCMAAG